MGKETKRISRLELYKQVWETPVTQLSKAYGLSDVGLAKICKKYNIPRPPRGYWAKKAAGQQLPKKTLPDKSSNEIIEISPNLANQFDSVPNAAILKEITNGPKHPPIVVAKALRNPHPFVSQSAEILELYKPNDDGVLISKNRRCLDIRVSPKRLRRALRIMDALIKALLKRGFEVQMNEKLVEVRIHGENLSFGLSEDLVTKKVQPDDSRFEGYYRFRHNRFDQVRVPAGRLCLTIHDSGYYGHQSLRRNWRDTKRKSIENSLDGFVTGLIKFAAKKKEYRLKQAEEERHRRERERLREEKRQRFAELKRQAQEEKERVAKLIKDAGDHHKAYQVRAFIEKVEKERLSGNPVYVADDDHEAWAKWAREQADRLDPLTESPASILDEIDDDDVGQNQTDRRFTPYLKPL